MPYTDSRLEAGRLRHRLELVTPTNTQDAAGGTSLESNTSFATVWGSIESITGRETLAANQFSSIVTHKITIRYRKGVLAKMQVHFSGRRFQIEAVLNPDERIKTLILLCVEIRDARQQVVPVNPDLK